MKIYIIQTLMLHSITSMMYNFLAYRNCQLSMVSKRLFNESNSTATGMTYPVISDTDDTTGQSHIAHSGTINSQGKFISKESEDPKSDPVDYTDFVGVKLNPKLGITSTITYYKPK